MKAGLNLFSIRNLIDTEKNFIATLIKLKEMGYSFAQFSGARYDHEMIARAVKETGMPIVVTHVPFDRIINDTEKLFAEHLAFGCKNVGLGAMPFNVLPDDDKIKEAVQNLQVAAEKIKSYGGKFFYHNHHYEFYRLDKKGKTIMDYMIENAPDINFILDSYWLQTGGVDTISFAEKVKGRIDCVHLKDYKIIRDGFKPTFAPIGEGNLDFNKIIKKWKQCGAKYFLVEQDDAADFEDTLGQVKISIDYLKKI